MAERKKPLSWTSVGELQHIAGLVESDKDSKELNKLLGMLINKRSGII